MQRTATTPRNGEKIRVAVRVGPLANYGPEDTDASPTLKAWPTTGKLLLDDAPLPSSTPRSARLPATPGRNSSRSEVSVFQFDNVFWSTPTATDEEGGQSATQAAVFDAMGKPLVKEALGGRNVSLFAYGQTGSGKTHTMMGDAAEPDRYAEDGLPAGAGMIPRLAEAVFAAIGQPKIEEVTTTADDRERVDVDTDEDDDDDSSSGDSSAIAETTDADESESATPSSTPIVVTPTAPAEKVRWQVRVGYLEVYNEEVFDLLAENPKKSKKKAAVAPLQLQMGQPVGQTLLPADCLEDVLRCLYRGDASRKKAETKMNKSSSRSHAIAQLFVQSFTTFTASDGTEAEVPGVKSRINLIDLAGSERASKTGATGATAEEAKFINKSLSSLGRVVDALLEVSSGRADVVVPYRDSVLTMLLKDSLGGSSATTMIATVSPSPENHGETRSTLNYSSRTGKIRLQGSGGEQHLSPLNIKLQQIDEAIHAINDKLTAPTGEEDDADLQQRLTRLTDTRDAIIHELAPAAPVAESDSSSAATSPADASTSSSETASHTDNIVSRSNTPQAIHGVAVAGDDEASDAEMHHSASTAEGRMSLREELLVSEGQDDDDDDDTVSEFATDSAESRRSGAVSPFADPSHTIPSMRREDFVGAAQNGGAAESTEPFDAPYALPTFAKLGRKDTAPFGQMVTKVDVAVETDTLDVMHIGVQVKPPTRLTRKPSGQSPGASPGATPGVSPRSGAVSPTRQSTGHVSVPVSPGGDPFEVAPFIPPPSRRPRSSAPDAVDGEEGETPSVPKDMEKVPFATTGRLVTLILITAMIILDLALPAGFGESIAFVHCAAFMGMLLVLNALFYAGTSVLSERNYRIPFKLLTMLYHLIFTCMCIVSGFSVLNAEGGTMVVWLLYCETPMFVFSLPAFDAARNISGFVTGICPAVMGVGFWVLANSRGPTEFVELGIPLVAHGLLTTVAWPCWKKSRATPYHKMGAVSHMFVTVCLLILWFVQMSAFDSNDNMLRFCTLLPPIICYTLLTINRR